MAGALWEQLYEALGTFAEKDESGDLQKFCEAWVDTLLDPVYELVKERDDSPPWAILFDPDHCPAASLPYLAQFTGVVITAEMDEAQIRREIKEPTGWARGRAPAVRLAAQRGLIGENPLVIIHQRTPEPGITYVRTLLSQTPDPDRTERLIRENLPAWELLNYEAIEGVTVEDVAASTNWETVADLAAAFETVQDLAEVTPEEI